MSDFNFSYVDPTLMGQQPQYTSSQGFNIDPSAWNSPDFSSSFLEGSPTTPKPSLWGNTMQGIDAASNLFNGWVGYQQMKTARDGLKESKRQFDMNWGAQKQLTNQQLWERRNAQIAAAGGTNNGLTPEEYVMQWGVQ